VIKATDGGRHSGREFFAGAARKELLLTLVSEKVGDELVYRIVSPDTSAGKKSPQRAA
jgi:hypothetical protein